MLQAVIADVSGNVIVQFPRELGDPIMNGLKAQEFKDFRDEKKVDVVRQYIKDNCEFKEHQLLLKIKNDQYQNQNAHNNHSDIAKMKFFAAKVLPYSVHDENQMLLSRLKVYE